METKQRTIANYLSLVIQRVVAVLLPARRRTEVLNDFFGEYVSTRQFVQDAADTVPYIVADEVRYTSSLKLLISQCLVLNVAFIGAAVTLPILPVFIVLGVATTVFVLRDAYFRPVLGSANAAIADGVLVAVFVFAAHVLLSVVAPSLALPGRVLLRGLTIGLLMMVTLRAAYWARYGKNRKGETPLAYRWSWRMNAVWLAGGFAEILTRREAFDREELILLFIPPVVFAVCSWLEKRGISVEEHEHTSLSLSTSMAMKKEKPSPNEVFFLLLFVFAASPIGQELMTNLTLSNVDAHWIRVWASFLLAFGTSVFLAYTLRYSKEKA